VHPVSAKNSVMKKCKKDAQTGCNGRAKDKLGDHGTRGGGEFWIEGGPQIACGEDCNFAIERSIGKRRKSLTETAPVYRPSLARLRLHKDHPNILAPCLERMGLVRSDDCRSIGIPVSAGASKTHPAFGEWQRDLDCMMRMKIRGLPGTTDRGIPTEVVLAEMRASDPPVQYLVGTPKGRLSRLERALLEQPWQSARPGVEVKLLPQDGEVYVLAQSVARVAKERAMRRRQLKGLWARLEQLAAMRLTRETLLMRLGAAQHKAPAAWRLVTVEMAAAEAGFTYGLDKDKFRAVRRREGRYLLRTNLIESDPVKLWSLYLQLVAVEEAFRNLKGDLAIRPIFHQEQTRIEAHIFISFLAYCLHVSLRCRARNLAPGLTPRGVLEKFAAMQMIDVHVPTTDGRELVMTRYTQPEPELQLLLDKFHLELPAQPPPRISAVDATQASLL
jgi:hypothetical protein